MHSVALVFGLADALSGVATCFQHCCECPQLQEPSGRMGASPDHLRPVEPGLKLELSSFS